MRNVSMDRWLIAAEKKSTKFSLEQTYLKWAKQFLQHWNKISKWTIDRII